jgi:DNA-directed RNA polymerase specialized sigma subunit
MKFNRDLIMSIREMLERHWNTAEIAAKLNLDATDVQNIINIINSVT